MRQPEPHGPVDVIPPTDPTEGGDPVRGGGGRSGVRSGVAIGALVLAAVYTLARPTIQMIAQSIQRREKHVRQTCHKLIAAGILTSRVTHVTGRVPTRVYAVHPGVLGISPRTPFSSPEVHPDIGDPGTTPEG